MVRYDRAVFLINFTRVAGRERRTSPNGWGGCRESRKTGEPVKSLLLLYVLYVCSGIVLAALAVPLMPRRVGPNPLYGFRVEKTLRHPDIWYAANAYSGRQLFWIGVGTVVVAVALYYVPRVTTESYAVACAAFIFGALAIGVWLSFRYLNRL
jgi:hypothetical protein